MTVLRKHVICKLSRAVGQYIEESASNSPARDKGQYAFDGTRALQKFDVIQIHEGVTFQTSRSVGEQGTCKVGVDRHECEFEFVRQAHGKEGQSAIARGAVVIEEDDAAQSLTHMTSISTPTIK